MIKMNVFEKAWWVLKESGERPLGYTPTDYDTEIDTAAAKAGGDPGSGGPSLGDIADGYERQDVPRLPEATSDGKTVTCPMCENPNAMHMMVPEVGPVLICQCGVYHTQ